MKKWYVYVTDRSNDSWMGNRVFANIYEAPDKKVVKILLLQDVDWLKTVSQRTTKDMPQYERFITSIHEIDEYWEGVFLKDIKCMGCLTSFRKIDKLKYNTGGNASFCSKECEDEYRQRLDPNAISTWNNGTVYKITHKPTGKFYIGVTTRWIMQRWWEHIKAESGSPFHQYMKDHDLTEFTFEILESFKPSECDPYEREAHWINHYDAINNGLNTAGAHKPKTIEIKEL